MSATRTRMLVTLLNSGLLLSAGPASALFSPRSPAARVLKTVDGNDWWLPAWVKYTPYSGYISWSRGWCRKRAGEKRYQDGNIHFAPYAFFTWNEINPREGFYDWNYVDRQIRKVASSPGTGFVFWINNYQKVDNDDRPGQPGIPPWVIEKAKIKFLSNGAVAAWDPNCEYQKYFGQMIRALGERYRDHPKLIGVDMRGLDVSWGEWCWRGGGSMVREAESNTGLSPAALQEWGNQFLDDFLEGFKGQEKKLVWINSNDSFIGGGKYGRASTALWKRAFAEGCGGRDGMVEVWMGYISDGYGMILDSNGYLEVNEEFAPIKNGCLWYTENECYMDHRGGFGTAATEALRWFTSNMRALQMRRNWIWPSVQAVDNLIPEFNRWMEYELGKTPETSPDAWSWLREGYLASWRRNRPVKNFERWLFQRDIGPDGKTVPVAKVDISNLGQEESGKGYEFHARRTDRASGDYYIYFRADPRFLSGGPYDMMLKVTYLDGPKARWAVEYSGGVQTEAAETQDTGNWKTVTFAMPAMMFGGGAKMDFRIPCAGPNDLTVKLVRLIKPSPALKKRVASRRSPTSGSKTGATGSSGQTASKPPDPSEGQKALAAAREAIQTATAAAADHLRGRIIAGVKSGRSERVYVDVGGRATRGKVVSADEDSVVIQVRGGQFPIPWKTLSVRRFAGIAAKYAGESVADRVLLAVFYAGANEFEKAGKILSSLDGVSDPHRTLVESVNLLVRAKN